MITFKTFARTATAVAAAGAVLLASGCAASSSEPAATDGAEAIKPAKITIATPTPAGSPMGVPLWIGELNGYFEEENLEVEVITFPGNPANAVSTVISGQADLVISAPAALITPTAEQGDQGLTWIFTPYQAPTFGIAVLEDSKFKDAGDLNGTTIATPSLGAPFEPFLESNMVAEGADKSTVNMVAVTGAAAVEQLRSGGVDAIVMHPGEIAQAAVSSGTDIRMLPLPEDVVSEFGAGFLMRSDSSDERKDVYSRYLRAYLKSVEFTRANPEAAMAMNIELYPEAASTDEVVTKAALANLEATIALFVPASNGQWGYIAPERWDAQVASLGFSEKIPDSSVLYDYSLLDSISDFDVSEVQRDAKEFTK